MKHAVVTADFAGKAQGKIKPLHGVNNSPVSLNVPPPGFREAGIPFCRLHDTAGAFGGAHYVDIPNVFPDFDADPADPRSYDFAFTDAYLKGLHAAGTEIFYRLGVTIENNYGIRAYHIHPPKDLAKWAEICAGIVRHYNRGWAGGFHYGIRYWEIWNEPENPPMWTGTREEYFELYRTASLRLKAEFPGIRVGGYGSCGFYAVTRPNCSDFFKSFPVWFDEFLKFVTAKETHCPLDFFSWHLYTADPREIVRHADYVQSKLAEYKLKECENIFNEWNYLSKDRENRWQLMKENEGASFVAAAFCLMQGSPVDKAMYYDAYPQRSYCGLYCFPGIRTTRTWSAFMLWNHLYALGTRRPASTDRATLFTCAASDRKDKGWLITNFSSEGCRITLEPGGVSLEALNGLLIDKRHDCKPLAPAREMVLGPFATLFLGTAAIRRDEPPAKPGKSPDAGLDEAGSKRRK